MKNSFFAAILLLIILVGCKDEITIPGDKQANSNYWISIGEGYGQYRGIQQCKNGYIIGGATIHLAISKDDGKTLSSLHDGLSTQGFLCTGMDDEIYVESDFKVLISNNYGKDWIQKVLYTDNIAPFIKAFARSKDGIVYAGTTLGIYSTTDKGETWNRSVKGMDNAYVKSLFVTSDGMILTGVESQDYSLYSSSDKGESWVKIESVKGQTISSFAEDSKGNLYAGGKFNFYKSTDKGKTWTSSVAPGTFSTDMICDKFDNIYASYTEGGVFVSEDGGDTWKEMNSGFKSSMAKSVNKLMIDRNGYIYAATNGGGVYKSRKSLY